MARHKQSPQVSYKQERLCVVIAERFGLTLPDGWDGDSWFMKNFLDAFAFDPETGEGGFDRVRYLIQYVREGRDFDDIARRMTLPRDQVRLMVAMLQATSTDLTETIDRGEPASDIEDEIADRGDWL
jgi:hypothetical protein